MKNMNIKAAIALALFAGSAMAAEKSVSKEVSVDVNVDGSDGKVTIVKNIDGDVSTITETIDLSGGEDMQATLDALLEEHGVDVNVEGAEIHKEVIMLNSDDMPHGDHKLMWVQKSDDVNVDLENGVAKVIIKKDNNGEVEVIEEIMDVGDDVNLDEFIDEIMAKHNIDATDGEVHKKIIKLDKRVVELSNDKPRLGFMASVEDDGWKVISVVEGSGAADAGLQAGDLILAVDDELAGKDALELDQFGKQDLAEGDISVLSVLRDGQEVRLNVEARVVNTPDLILKGKNRWVSEGGDVSIIRAPGTGKTIAIEKAMAHVDGLLSEGMNLKDHEVHVMTTGDADAYFFSSGKMNQWLGKTHHFSTVTKDLGKYFGVDQGVLVLEVGADNKLGLQDGDVIQSINGEIVNSPKDVVKKMSALKNDDQVEIEIYRNKEKLYLES